LTPGSRETPIFRRFLRYAALVLVKNFCPPPYLSSYLPEFTATIGHAENPLMTPMNRANRSCRQWAYQVRLAMHLVRLGLVASIGLAPSVVRQSRLTLPQDRLSASTCRPSRPISGWTLSQRIHKKLLVSFVLSDLANYNRLSWRRSTRE